MARARETDSPTLHVVLFLVALLSGVFAIVSLKLVLPISQVVVTAVPIAIMTAYAVVIGVLRRLRLRFDQAADNLYYLGFLYTLASLAISLYQYSTTANPTDDIIENFGIALATTIWGISLRVIFSQMRRDPVEIERQSRLELAEASREMRTQLTGAAMEFDSFRREMQQRVVDAHEELRTRIDQTLSSAIGKLEEIIASSAASIELSHEQLSKKALDINQSSEAIVGALSNLAQKISGVELPVDIIERQLKPATDMIERAAVVMSELTSKEVDQRERWMASVQVLADLSQSIRDYMDRASQSATAVLSRQAKELESIVAQMNQAATSMSSIGELPAHMEMVESSVAAVGRVVASMQSVGDFGEQIQKLEGAIAAISNGAGAVQRSSESQAKALEELVAAQGLMVEAAQDMSKLAKQVESIEAIISRIGRATAKLEESSIRSDAEKRAPFLAAEVPNPDGQDEQVTGRTLRPVPEIPQVAAIGGVREPRKLFGFFGRRGEG